MFTNRVNAGRPSARVACCLALVLLLVPFAQGRVPAQSRAEAEMEKRVRELLKAEEFKQERAELVAMGARALPVLLKIFLASSDDEQLVRIMSVLREIEGNKGEFLKKAAQLAKASPPHVQTGAIVLLGVIGTAQQAPPLEEVVASEQQPEFARINAARALVRIGTTESLEVVNKALQAQRRKAGSRALIQALEGSAKALSERHKE